ncbi:hypothetical protein TNCV_4465051 [Trichonephila clavipes]|nr:hypothetical protein TNCV_4465051 [Trichonephila clavipes]
MRHLARERIGMASEKMKIRYDERATGHDFHEGDEQCRPLRHNGCDSMRTWRNFGVRAKLASFLTTKLAANLATILASLETMLVSSEPSGIF